MAAAEPNVLSTNESDFLLSALAEGLRVDGRYLLERRRVRRACRRLSVIALPGPTLSQLQFRAGATRFAPLYAPPCPSHAHRAAGAH